MLSLARYKLAQALRCDLERQLEVAAEVAEARHIVRHQSLLDSKVHRSLLSRREHSDDSPRPKAAIRRQPQGAQPVLTPVITSDCAAGICSCLAGRGTDATVA